MAVGVGWVGCLVRRRVLQAATAVQPGGSAKDKKNGINNTFLANFSAVCLLTIRDIARMHYTQQGSRPVALIQSAWGGTRVEAWMSKEAIAKAIPSAGASPPPNPNGANNVSVLYNAMVAPWNKFAVRAALWYQGEANADQNIPGNDQTGQVPILLPFTALRTHAWHDMPMQ